MLTLNKIKNLTKESQRERERGREICYVVAKPKMIMVGYSKFILIFYLLPLTYLPSAL